MSILDEIFGQSQAETDAIVAAVKQTRELTAAVKALLVAGNVEEAIALIDDIDANAEKVVSVTLENTEHAALLDHPALQ